MEIIIGRDVQTQQLCIVKDGQAFRLGQPGTVPMDVSRQHISLSPLGSGMWQLRNLKSNNITFVNGVAAETKTVTESDRIELGRSHFLFQWKAILEAKIETIDITQLQRTWDWYEREQLKMKEDERKKQNIQRLSGILSSCGILFMFVDGLGPMRYILTGLSVLIAIYFFIKGMSSDSSLNIKLNELSKEFRYKYKCPKCGHFMGYTPYDVLIQNDACPYCRTKYKKQNS